LAAMTSMRGTAPAINAAERLQRVAKAQDLMRAGSIAALWLDVSTSLTYFTGLRFGRSERLHGAVLTARGLTFVSPAFEVEKLRAMLTAVGSSPHSAIAAWEEHENPAALVVKLFREQGIGGGRIALDEATPFATFDQLRRCGGAYEYVSGSVITEPCRHCKSATEIALMQTAKTITMTVQRAAARILHSGITTTDVQAFVAAAHAKLGAEGPLPFNIVLFGEATAYPHGVPYPQTLKSGDMVLVDCGAPVDGYLSDITRSYVFGAPSPRQRQLWDRKRLPNLQPSPPPGSAKPAATSTRPPAR
jgi:Xaa-Pro dipeptidase